MKELVIVLRPFFWAAVVLLGFWAALSESHAQTLTFSAETTTGVESVVPKLTWSTSPAAASCTASGDWTGTQASSGTVTLPAISQSKTYALKCDWPGDTTATVSWIAPTTNTDGTPLTNLAGFKIKYGVDAHNLDRVFDVTRPTATSQLLTGLAAGTWHFGVLAYNSAGAESALAGPVSKVITATQSVSRTVAVTVNPRPSPPTELAVK